jgi:hypothetical protein
MKPFFTVREACAANQLDRSPNWIRAAIKLGKIKAVKAGNTLLIPVEEINRIKASTPTISRDELLANRGGNFR